MAEVNLEVWDGSQRPQVDQLTLDLIWVPGAFLHLGREVLDPTTSW
jgi:hypothetical protein